MTKTTLNLMTAVMIVSTALISCNNKGNGNVKSVENIAEEETVTESNTVKLLESLTEEGDREMYVTNFEYDEQNRIVKFSREDYAADDVYFLQGTKTTTITYANNQITVKQIDDNNKKTVRKFTLNGNKMTVDRESFTLNKDGYIVKNRYTEYTYKQGNLTQILWTESAYTDDYSYDKKQSPFSNSNTPKWLMQMLFSDVWASKNNVIKYQGENSNCTYKYTYDSDGFPISLTGKCCDYDEDCSDGAEFKKTYNYTN